MLADFKYALRQLAKSPAYTAIAVLTLSLAIGACTIVFTAVDSTLLQPVDNAHPDRTILLFETLLPRIPQTRLSAPDFIDLEREAKSFEFLSAWAGMSADFAGTGEPLRLDGAWISPRQLEAWGTRIVLGRPFAADEYKPGRNNVCILRYSFWQREFGGDRGVIGRVIELNSIPTTVVGVMSANFERYGSENQIFEPLAFTDEMRSDRARMNHSLVVGGLLQTGVTLEQAQAELSVLGPRLARQHPATNKGEGLLVRNQSVYINRALTPLLRILLGAVGCVLLIACANVANLALGKATVRQREISIRAALGASRARLIRQLLIESVILAVLGGGGGLLLAEWGLPFLRSLASDAGTTLARLAYVELSPGMLAFTLLFSAAVGIFFGLAPAWLASRVELSQALKQGSRGSAGGSAGRMRSLLVGCEVALSLVLLGAAGLLIHSFREIARQDPGFSPDHVISMDVSLQPGKYGGAQPDQRIGFVRALLERLQALPQVRSAGLTTLSPFNNPSPGPFGIEGRPAASAGDRPAAVAYGLTPDYFRTMGIRLLRGRAFSERDNASEPLVLVINQSLADEYFPNENPLGRRLNFGTDAAPFWGEIVGIVNDVMQGSPGQVIPPQVYYPWLQMSGGGFFVMARVTGDPAAVIGLLKDQVYAVDRNQPVATVRTLDNWMDSVLASQRLTLRFLSAFAAIAVVIAMVGIYGVMAYDVSQRTVEFGIRMALGAGPRQILGQTLGRGMRVVAIGAAAGLALTLGIGRILASLLYKTSPYDFPTLGGIIVLLLAVSFVACLIPARRATKVDPLVALRAE